MNAFSSESALKGRCIESFPLTFFKTGEAVCISQIGGGKELKETCAQQGLLPGHTIKLMQKNAGGACVVEVQGGRVMLGAELSRRILVQALN